MAQLVKNLHAIWETWVQSLGWEVPLEKGKATYSGILAWRIPWTRGHKDSDMTEQISLHFPQLNVECEAYLEIVHSVQLPIPGLSLL